MKGRVLITGLLLAMLAACATTGQDIGRTYDCGEGLILKVTLTGSIAIVHAGSSPSVTLRPVHSTTVSVYESKAGHRLSMTDGMATWQAPKLEGARHCRIMGGHHH